MEDGYPRSPGSEVREPEEKVPRPTLLGRTTK